MPTEKGFKFQLYPTKSQIAKIEMFFGCARFTFNHSLEYFFHLLDTKNKIPSKFDSEKFLHNELKANNSFLKLADKFVCESALFNAHESIISFLKKEKGRPNFKSKHNLRQSYTTKFTNNNIEIFKDSFKIKLPKLGLVSIRGTSFPQGKIRGATIKKINSKYYVSINALEEVAPLTSINNTCGIDLGLTDELVFDDGTKIKAPKTINKYDKQLIRRQRSLSRKKKGSSNYLKAKLMLAKKHKKVSDVRKDFLHKTTTEIIRKYDTICLETLDIKEMLSNGNKRINRSFMDASISELNRMLTYKAAWYGRKILRINKYAKSSQTCSNCGYVDPITKDLHVRNWTCPNCGSHHDRDINAAKNIKLMALSL